MVGAGSTSVPVSSQSARSSNLKDQVKQKLWLITDDLRQAKTEDEIFFLAVFIVALLRSGNRYCRADRPSVLEMRLFIAIQLWSVPYVLSYSQNPLYTPEFCPWAPEISRSQSYCRLVDEIDVKAHSQGFVDHVENAGDGEGVLQGPHKCIGKYCVWFKSEFSGQEMAIITTSENSQRIGRPSFAKPNTHLSSSHFRMTQIPGKGVGMIAARTIHRGEQIVAARPVMLVHRQLIDELALEDQHRLLETAMDQLPPTRQQQFLAQAGEVGGHEIEDIMFTNSFQISLGQGYSQHFGNFPEVSRYNHDCRPNVAFYIDQNLTHHTHAIRDIQAGEELTISYLDSFRARSVRQERARASWGFSCTCPQCSLPKAEADASDARLYSIYQVENQAADYSNENTTPAMVEDLIRLYKAERLDFKIGDAYTIAALNYNLFGMVEMAKMYAKLSLEQGLLEHGPDALDREAMRILMDDPKGHWSYNRRPYVEK
ncbi:hypothetical protein BJ170DRAFT_447834 [Xylariales sp. AK1849]|nr:hypothetical protein BJ170DRAFT_447834 [Xylariales sp. AK1849]